MKIIYTLLLMLLLCLTCGKSDDRNIHKTMERPAVAPWPHFRGNAQLHGIAPGTVADTLKIFWTFKANGAFISSPVTDGNNIYIGSLDSTLYALDVHTGTPVWKFKSEDEIEASPVIHKDMILIGDLGGNFFSINKNTGTEIWRFKVKDKIAGSANVIPNSERVIFGSYDNNLYCLNMKNGELVWTYSTGSYINGTPATDGERIVFGGCDAGVHVLNAEDGTLIGKIDTESYIAGSAAMRGEFAYIGSYGQKLLGLDIREMKTAWTYTNDGRKAPYVGSPALVDTLLIAPSKDNHVHCVSANTGKLVWKFLAKKDVESSPVISSNGRVVFGCNAGWLYVVDLKTGALVNQYNMGGALIGAPLVSGGIVIVGSENGTLTAMRSKS